MSLLYKLNDLEELVFNEGERLIPGKTHRPEELTRHLSSYNFFKDRILEDRHLITYPFTIADLGSGVGYCCKLLSEIPYSIIIGVDNSEACRLYAKEHYSGSNIHYKTEDLHDFIANMSAYDYVVSRGVFEHIEDGLTLATKVKFNRMFIFDVPYNEAPGNPHHKLLGITEDSFSGFKNKELYYQDLAGKITLTNIGKPNMVGCLCKP